MFRLLKQVILYIYFIFVRSSKQEKLIKLLTGRFKKRELDMPYIPAVLDEVQDLPERWQDSTSFVGFDQNGLCVRFKAGRTHIGCTDLQIDLDIPGSGHFVHKEVFSNVTKHDDGLDTIFEGRRLKAYCLSPMRRWKLCFRGPLRHTNLGDKRLHAVISLYWQGSFDPYDYFYSPSCWRTAYNLSSLGWREIFTFSMFDKIASYEQWGELRGRINIENQEEMNVRLKCVRERHFKLQVFDFESVVRQHFVEKESGLAFSHHFIKVCKETSAYCGYMTFPISDSHPTVLLYNTKGHEDNKSYLLKFPQSISASRNLYKVSENISRTCFCDPQLGFEYKSLTINNKTAFGVQCFSDEAFDLLEQQTYSVKLGEESANGHVKTNTKEDKETDIVALDASACKLSLVGGKAYYLSLLRSSGNVNVPNGFCITTMALIKHINENYALKQVIKQIENCLKESGVGTLKKMCDNAVRLFQQVPMSNNLKTLLTNHLVDLFGKEEWKRTKFAIRSSSLSEDASDTSAAGQMKTFLCIHGLENIVSAVQHCWASSISYQVVEYRRQNGQSFIEGMGVVVQEMVEADVSGVVFTADPLTGEESNMMINANFGLGESVVSGSVNPDTIIVNRGYDDKLRVEKILTGSKETRCIADEYKGTINEPNADSARNRVCITENDIFLVSEQAIELERNLCMSLDVEWAIAKGKLYILQTRPITGLDQETDEELIHEFDSPVVSERELITTCNIQEMMPGAVTTLTRDLFISAVGRALAYNHLSRMGIEQSCYVSNAAITFSGLSFLNVTFTATAGITGIGGDSAKSNAEICILGHSVENHYINTIHDFIGRKFSFLQKVMRVFREFVVLNKRDSSLFEHHKGKIETFDIEGHFETAQALYNCIDENLIFYYEVWRSYIFKATESGIWSGIIMAILKGDAKELSLKHLTDLALILSDCKNIISAEVPSIISSLAEKIANSNIRDQFLDAPAEDCDSLLRNSSDSAIKTEYIQLMKRHGHRSIREAELMEKSWEQDPRELMKSIKLVVRQGTFQNREKKSRTIDEIIDDLQTNLNRFQKMLLRRFLIKNAMHGVAAREIGKSYIIKASDIFKRAYWKLADMMVSECRLPEPELLFFLTHREIGKLIRTRSTKLVRLAKRRKMILPEMNKIKYPKINFGVPKQLKKERQCRERNKSTNFTLLGMPVCRGKVQGRACVVKSVQEANQILEGDVLICEFTDVGWSPYFPLLSGLVTEMGGLVAHGAVVAREYGIPCIVGTDDATDLIHTGDKVVLDATAGTISIMQ